MVSAPLSLPAIAGNVDHIAVFDRLTIDRVPEKTTIIIDEAVLSQIDASLLHGHHVIVLPGSEATKSTDVFESLQRDHAAGLASTKNLLAIGGGTILNLATSLAHEKNLPLVLVPTTVLAMVDVAYGSLGRLNQGGMKNIRRVTFDPTAIVLDINFIDRLPTPEIKRGLSESLKHALLQSSPERPDDHCPSVTECLELLHATNLDRTAVGQVVRKTLQAKAAVIMAIKAGNKEIENILSYGHVDAEPREAASTFRLSHGDAVLLGLAVELRLCGDQHAYADIIRAISHTPLGQELPRIDFSEAAMRAAYANSCKPRFKAGTDRYRIIRLPRAGYFRTLTATTPVDFLETDFDALYTTAKQVIAQTASII